MLKLNKVDNYVSILGSDATFRKVVPEGTPGSVVREYETSDGKKGTKTELVFNELSGKITNIEMHEGNFGNNLQVTFSDTDGDVTLSIGTNTSFGEDFMKKLPALNLDVEIVAKPYNFTDDRGKTMKGITLLQNETKVENFFWDKEKKEGINGLPKPKGDTSKFTKDKWKIYFTEVKIFLEEYVTEKFVKAVKKADTTANAVMEDLDKGIDPESINI